ncbi:MAG: RNA-binding S4 domain-containing protein [Flavobacteriales bacterium]|nr:RNA-binding S4 domain-containing protein [Flavobacteriales bacterium]
MSKRPTGRPTKAGRPESTGKRPARTRAANHDRPRDRDGRTDERPPKRPAATGRPAWKRDDDPGGGRPRRAAGPAGRSKATGASDRPRRDGQVGRSEERPHRSKASGRPPRDRDAGTGRGRAARATERGPGRPAGVGRPHREGRPEGTSRGPAKPWKKQGRDEREFREGDPLARRPFRKGERSNRFSLPNPANEGLVRLNKYLAHAGVGSRREADTLIAAGAVTVNGKVVTELGAKVKPDDVVHFGGDKLRMEQKRYVLLNKPKDTITTTDDPRERHTVMSLIAKACPERLYPVGRLDRNTTGVLLLTNDGDLAKKLTHPSHGAQKLYHATLDRALTVEELHKLVDGVMLEDGLAQADEASFAGDSKREVGLSIHMGRNRVVRRMFTALGAEVVKLDRVMFAGLTKKDLPRGHWRHLEEKEVTWLQQIKPAPKGATQQTGGRRTRLSQGSE